MKHKSIITIRLDPSVLRYFKSLSKRLDKPYQSLINGALLHAAQNNFTPDPITWSAD
jgi:uncharacterized protein (DUF4415 family)